MSMLLIFFFIIFFSKCCFGLGMFVFGWNIRCNLDFYVELNHSAKSFFPLKRTQKKKKYDLRIFCEGIALHPANSSGDKW